MLTQQLLLGMARDRGQGIVAKCEQPVGIDFVITVLDIFNDGSVFFFADAHGCFGKSALVNGKLGVGTEYGKEAQYQKTGEKIVELGADDPLKKAHIAEKHGVNQGFQKPVKKGQAKADEGHMIQQPVSFFHISLHCMYSMAGRRSSVQNSTPL